MAKLGSWLCQLVPQLGISSWDMFSGCVAWPLQYASVGYNVLWLILGFFIGKAIWDGMIARK